MSQLIISKISGKQEALIMTSELKLIFFWTFFLYQIRTQFNGANVRLSYFKKFCLCSIKNEYLVIMFGRHII